MSGPSEEHDPVTCSADTAAEECSMQYQIDGQGTQQATVPVNLEPWPTFLKLRPHYSTCVTNELTAVVDFAAHLDWCNHSVLIIGLDCFLAGLQERTTLGRRSPLQEPPRIAQQTFSLLGRDVLSGLPGPTRSERSTHCLM